MSPSKREQGASTTAEPTAGTKRLLAGLQL